MSDPRYPSLYQINTRVWLTELSRPLGRRATLDDVPDAELDRLAQTGLRLALVPERLADRCRRRRRCRARNPGWRREFEETLPDLDDDDIAGSGFAITELHASIATSAATRRWRGCASDCRSAA